MTVWFSKTEILEPTLKLT